MPKHDKTRKAQARAHRLRKEMTPSELVLWKRLRRSQLGVRFRRQEPIGHYIVDFACRSRKLIVEADGNHHEHSRHDEIRDRFLTDEGYRVVRFWNEDIARYPDWVIEQIRKALTVQSG